MATKKFEKLALSISAKGIPCLWENGGKLTDDFGQSFIIADKYANAKTALYLRRDGKANSGHALVPVRVHDIVVVCRVKDDVSTIQIYSISKIDSEQKIAHVDMINSFENGEWAAVPNAIYDKVIEIAKMKATMKNCTKAMYVIEKQIVKKDEE